MAFGFDPSVILAGLRNQQPWDPVETFQTLGNLAAQRAHQQQQQQMHQATLGYLLRKRAREQTLVELVRTHARASPEARAQALMDAGFLDQARAEQDQAAQSAKAFREGRAAEQKQVGEAFYGVKDQAGWDAALQQVPEHYRQMLPAQFDAAAAERLGNLAVPAEKRASIAATAGKGPTVTDENGNVYRLQGGGTTAAPVTDNKGNQIKARVPGRGRGAGGGGGGPGEDLSPEAITALAEKFNATGEITGLGAGKQSWGTRVKVMNRALELKPSADLAGAGADYKANSASLKKLQTQADAVDAFEHTAEKNLDTFTELAQKTLGSGSPLLNAPARKFQEMIAGDPNLAALNAARVTALTEISKVLSGATGSAAVSDSARHEVESLIKEGASIEQIMAAANILKRDMANRKTAVQEQLSQMRERISGKRPGGESATAKRPVKYLVSPDKKQRVPVYADGSKGAVEPNP